MAIWRRPKNYVVITVILVAIGLIAAVGVTAGGEAHRVFIPLAYNQHGGTPAEGTATPTPTVSPTPTGTQITEPTPAGSLFGVVMNYGIYPQQGLYQAVEAGVKWSRILLSWRIAQPSQDTPLDSLNLGNYDIYLSNAYSAGITVVVTIGDNPTWASTTRNGPIDLVDLSKFQTFLTALVNRYKDPPYGVKYWQFYNEPDNTDPRYEAKNWGFWGWVRITDVTRDGNSVMGGYSDGQVTISSAEAALHETPTTDAQTPTTPSPTSFPGTVQLKLNPASPLVQVGDIVTMAVQMQAGTQPVDKAEVHLNFDPTRLQVVDAGGSPSTSIIAGDVFTMPLQNRVNNDYGYIDYIAERPGGPISGTVTLASIRFKALTGGTAWVRFLFDSAPPKYAQMLQAAYEAIKAADPEATVVLGGLAMDWFTDDGFYGWPWGIFNRQFLQMVIDAGGAPYFDVIDFHVYPYFSPRWEALMPGKGMLAKANYIKYHYGLGKPLICTEVGQAVELGENARPDRTLEDQANYVVVAFARSLAGNLQAVLWYTMVDSDIIEEGVLRHYGLVYKDLSPKPSFYAYKAMTQLLTAARYLRTLTAAEFGLTDTPELGFEGYMFRTADGTKDVQVIWANLNTPGVLVPATNNLRILDRNGNELPLNQNPPGSQYAQVNIGPSPVYLVRDSQ